MTQSIVRYLVVSLMTYLVTHGVITQKIADANMAAWTNTGIIVATVGGAIIWSFLEKKYKGVIVAYFPSSTPGRTTDAIKMLLALAIASACVLLVSHS